MTADWMFYEDYWNEVSKKNMTTEEIIDSIKEEKPTAKLIGKMGTDILVEKVTNIYKTKLSNGKKVIFHVPPVIGTELKKEMEALDLISWIHN